MEKYVMLTLYCRSTAVGTIVASCGQYRGGEVYVQSYDKSYGGNSADRDICLH